MERRNGNGWNAGAAGLAGVIALAVAGLSGCGSERADDPSPTPPPSGWGQTARLESVERSETGATVSGRAPAGARVVLTGLDGAAWASVAGPDGVFEVRVAPAVGPMLYRAEIRDVPNDVWTGDWLALTPDPGGVSAALRPGAAARPLEGGALLGAVDYDGAVALVSGEAAPEAMVRVILDERPPVAVQSGPDGLYTARFASVPPGPRRIRVVSGERTAEALLTLARPDGDELRASPRGDGVVIDWALPGGGVQSTWIAHAAAGR